MLDRVLDHPRLRFLIILIGSLLLYFPFLGARDFWDQENMYAEVTRVMLLESNWALPQVNGELWLDNPPLFYWLALFFSWLAGAVSEWTVRLTPALSATLLVLALYVFLSKRFTPRLGFLTALIFATSLLTVHVERHVPINMLFYLFDIVATLFLMEVLVFGSRRRVDAYGMWLFLGLACLTKGAIAVLLPALVTAGYLILSGCWKQIAALRPVRGMLLFLSVTAPWYIFAGRHATTLAAGALHAHGHNAGGQSLLYNYLIELPGSIWYSLINFPLDFMPWTFLLLPALIVLWPERSRLMQGPGLFLLLWFLSVFLFPHLSVVEHSHYLFLALVPTSLVTALHLDSILSGRADPRALQWTRRFVLAFCCLIAVLGIALPFIALRQAPDLFMADLVVGLTGVIGVLWLLRHLQRRNYGALAIGPAAMMIAINLLVQGLILPPVNRLQVRPFAESLGAVVNPDGKVGVYFSGQPAFREFNFYARLKRVETLKNPEEVVKFLELPGPRFVVVTQRRRPQIQKLWPGELKPVLAQAGGELTWWFPASGRWLLLHSCSSECGAARPAASTSAGPAAESG